MTKGKPQQDPDAGVVNLPVQWQIPDNAVAGYATNFVVQRMQHEYLISFFQIQPPLLLGSPDQLTEQVSRLDKVDARLLAQIIIAESRLAEFQQLLSMATTLTPVAQTGASNASQE